MALQAYKEVVIARATLAFFPYLTNVYGQHFLADPVEEGIEEFLEEKIPSWCPMVKNRMFFLGDTDGAGSGAGILLKPAAHAWRAAYRDPKP